MAFSRVIWMCLFASFCLITPALLNPIPGYIDEDDDDVNEIDDKEEILGEGDEDYEYVEDPDFKAEDDYGLDEDDYEGIIKHDGYESEEDEDQEDEVNVEELESKSRRKRDLEDSDDEDWEYFYDFEPEEVEQNEEGQFKSRVKRDLEVSDDEEEYDALKDENYEPEEVEYEYDALNDENYEPEEVEYEYDDYDEDDDFISNNKVKRDLGDLIDPEEEDLRTMESAESANIDLSSEDDKLAKEGEDDDGKPFGVINLKDVRNPAFMEDMHKKAMEYLSEVSKRKTG